MLVGLRIGPWCHGEARHGGLPDWVVNSGAQLRTNTTQFMGMVEAWYLALSVQLKGTMWADGGPVISVQLDNETPDVDYLLALRALALASGISPPFFAKTMWPAPNAPVPPGLLVPYGGGYTDSFWGNDMGPVYSYSFLYYASTKDDYPSVTVEVRVLAPVAIA
jgi:hypothetical protein